MEAVDPPAFDPPAVVADEHSENWIAGPWSSFFLRVFFCNAANEIWGPESGEAEVSGLKISFFELIHCIWILKRFFGAWKVDFAVFSNDFPLFSRVVDAGVISISLFRPFRETNGNINPKFLGEVEERFGG